MFKIDVKNSKNWYYLLIFIILAVIFLFQIIFIHSYYPVTISSTLEKNDKTNTEYIVNLNMPNHSLNPVIIENVWWLGRFDRTTVYAEVIQKHEDDKFKQYCATLYGIRIPSISYQGLVKLENCSKN